MYNSYGGQFQGLNPCLAGRELERRLPTKILDSPATPTHPALCAAARKSAPESTGNLKGRGGSSPVRPSGAGVEDDSPGEKVVVNIGQLKKVEMEQLKDGDERMFVVSAFFEGQELSEIIQKKRNRTKLVAATFAHSHWYCSFAGEKIVLPIEDPQKRLLLYVSAVTVKQVEDPSGKLCKDISLVGIGFSQPFSVKTCKKFPHASIPLRTVEGGDPSIKPGSLDVSVDVCKMNQGEPVPDDISENVLAQFQV